MLINSGLLGLCLSDRGNGVAWGNARSALAQKLGSATKTEVEPPATLLPTRVRGWIIAVRFQRICQVYRDQVCCQS